MIRLESLPKLPSDVQVGAPLVSTLFSLKQSIMRNSKPGKEDFNTFLQQMKNDMNADLEREDDYYFELNAKALIGDPRAVSYFMNQIEKYLRKTPYTGKIPEAYPTAAEAPAGRWPSPLEPVA
ncbi:MAG: hypothetical protein K6T78_13840 [Alicyclobacillus sp.]|nr:hypothetical protein [Alicyclobacillus sp.]